jgi:hypothetical protein
MGVDACIFAVEDKRYFYFDRKRNFSLDYQSEDVLTYADVHRVCVDNVATDNARSWNESILAFIDRHETNTFRIVSDHDGPDFSDVADAGAYVEEGLDPSDAYRKLKYLLRSATGKGEAEIIRQMLRGFEQLRVSLNITEPVHVPLTPEQREGMLALERALSAGYQSPGPLLKGAALRIEDLELPKRKP